MRSPKRIMHSCFHLLGQVVSSFAHEQRTCLTVSKIRLSAASFRTTSAASSGMNRHLAVGMHKAGRVTSPAISP